MARRLFLTMLAVAFAAALVAPVAASAGAARPVSVQPAFGGGCVPSRFKAREMEGLAEYVLLRYEAVSPEDEQSTPLTREINKAEYFGRLSCFVRQVESAITREVRYDQPGEDAGAAIEWFRAVVAIQT